MPETFFMDITPKGCQTPEGNARVNKALTDLENARASVAMDSQRFFRKYASVIKAALQNPKLDEDPEYCAEVVGEIDELESKIERANELHEEFLLALAGRPSRA